MKKVFLTLTAALTLGALTTSVMAQDVTQGITAGTGTASVADLALGTLPYSHAAQTSTGTMALTVNDSTGSGAGWNATILSSAFVSTGNPSIAAANFSLASAAAPVMTAGQAVSATQAEGPAVPTTSPVGTLDSARKTVQAGAGFGQGTYTQALGVSLAIPAQARAGTYTGTITSTFTAAP